MLAIKLKIVGRRNQRTFRVIVQEARSKLDGKFVEDLGWYNPHTNQIKVNKKRASYWVENGAQPTERVKKILEKAETSETVSYAPSKKRPRKLVKAAKTAGGGSPHAESTQTDADSAQVSAEKAPTEAVEAEGAEEKAQAQTGTDSMQTDAEKTDEERAETGTERESSRDTEASAGKEVDVTLPAQEGASEGQAEGGRTDAKETPADDVADPDSNRMP